MLIENIKSQLAVANASNLQLRHTIDTLNTTIADLRATIANLESLLQERDSVLGKAKNQLRGMSKLIEKKSERQSVVVAEPKTEEEGKQEEASRA